MKWSGAAEEWEWVKELGCGAVLRLRLGWGVVGCRRQ